jgi:hypothetical protein
MGWMAEEFGFDSRKDYETFLNSATSRPALEPTQPPILYVPGALSLGGKLAGREADNSPPSHAGVKNDVTIFSLPYMSL